MDADVFSNGTLRVGVYTEEMQAEMDRLAEIAPQAVDFDCPPDEAARKVDEDVNAVWNIDQPEVASVRHIQIPGGGTLSAADCDAVIYTPADPGEGLIFFVHGGGWAFCSLVTHERFMRVLCNESRKTVVGVHYRLAPENPYPAGLKDVVSAFRRVLSSRAEFGLPEGPVVIAGDSAGGNLALTTMLHEVNADRELPAGALLFYGVFGADFDTPSYQAYAEDHLLTTAIMKQLWNWYIPDVAARNDALAAPILASDAQLRALPPLFILAAEMDPIASDTYNLKQRLDQIGRNDELLIEPGVVHGFLQMTAVLEAARRATRKAAEAANKFMESASA